MRDQTFDAFRSPGEIKNRVDKKDRLMPKPEKERVSRDLLGLGPRKKDERDPEEFTAARMLERELLRTIQGEVRFDRGTRAMYATDASNYRQVPIGVVVPISREDIVETVAVAKRFGAPILSRGGGTSLAGQTCNVAVVIDTSKYYNHILDIDVENKIARVEPGIVLDVLKKETEQYGLTVGPDPATHSRCTIGGMIGNNSCGAHAQWAGRMEGSVEWLEVLTYDGERFRVGPTSEDEFRKILAQGGRRSEIYSGLRSIGDRYGAEIRRRFPKIPRKVSGFCLDELLPENSFNVARSLVGTESTCVTILEAGIRLFTKPKFKAIVVLGYRDIFVAADHVAAVLPFAPMALEGIDNRLVQRMKDKNLHKDDLSLLPEGQGWLMVELGAQTKGEVELQAKVMAATLKRHPSVLGVKLLLDPDEQKKMWTVRESGLGATAWVPGQPAAWEGWEDAAVAPASIGVYLREFQKLLDKYGYDGPLYGHFGQGCIHTRIDFDLFNKSGIEKYRQFIHEGAHLVVKHGGSLSGEHGDGQSRAELLPIMFGQNLVRAFEEFKDLWDPLGKMNPGKIVRSYRSDQNLRYGTDYNPPHWQTHFQFPEDEGSFARAAARCVGVGECRRHEHGTMCPSYMVTKEERDSTRGRARLLFEMLEGNPLKKTWREDKVKESLDLCLACKGCKGDCPVNVDMATYKSEFLSHYYERRLRPRAAFSMGLIQMWAPFAATAPGLLNSLTSCRPTSAVMKFLGGIAQDRAIPRFAPKSFRSWFKSRPVSSQTGTRVILWTDTFNNYFHPHIARAAVETLEAGGFHVEIPKSRLCCGRPLYDYGKLNVAKHHLREILKSLAEEIRQGVPVIGLEPSCTAVFRDELCQLFPHDMNAQRLKSQTFLLSEFVSQHRERFRFRAIGKKAIVHGHCHQTAVIGMKSDMEVLSLAGLSPELLDSGCCGMAGSFGFEKNHSEISRQIGERVLLPKARTLKENEILVTNGFSCREQIVQETDKVPLHMAEVLRQSLF